jgi:hypothetical protein
MDGLRLAAAIRRRWPPIHVIVVTGFTPPNKSELPATVFSSRSRTARPKSFQRSGTSSRPGNCYDNGGPVSATCTRNLGSCPRCGRHFRRALRAFALKSIVRGKKANRTIGKLLLIHNAPLRYVDGRNGSSARLRGGLPRSFLPVRGLVQFIGVTADTSDSDKGRLRIRESILYAHPASTTSRHIALAGAAM